MNEIVFNTLYFGSGVFVGIVSCILTVLVMRRDQQTGLESVVIGGVLGIICGLLWPLVVAAIFVSIFSLGISTLHKELTAKS